MDYLERMYRDYEFDDAPASYPDVRSPFTFVSQKAFPVDSGSTSAAVAKDDERAALDVNAGISTGTGRGGMGARVGRFSANNPELVALVIGAASVYLSKKACDGVGAFFRRRRRDSGQA